MAKVQCNTFQFLRFTSMPFLIKCKTRSPTLILLLHDHPSSDPCKMQLVFIFVRILLTDLILILVMSAGQIRRWKLPGQHKAPVTSRWRPSTISRSTCFTLFTASAPFFNRLFAALLWPHFQLRHQGWPPCSWSFLWRVILTTTAGFAATGTPAAATPPPAAAPP